MKKKRTFKYTLIRFITDFMIYGLLFCITLMILLPVFWIIISSFQQSNSLYSSSFITQSLTLKHYKELFTDTDFPLWYGNTLRIALINMVLSVIITTLIAYGFSRYQFKGKKATMITILVLQMFPSFLTMIAIYILLNKLGLLNHYWGLILVYVSGQIPYNTWLVKGYLDGIPKNLDEVARIDGASEFMIFRKIIIPLGRPVIVLVALSNFIGPWFDFIFPKILLRSKEQMTLAVGIFDWIKERADDKFTQFAAASILVAVPITILFAYLQKHIVEGLSKGATKG